MMSKSHESKLEVDEDGYYYISVAPEIEEAEVFLRIGNTVIMKRKDEIPPEVVADIKIIFDTPLIRYYSPEEAEVFVRCLFNPDSPEAINPYRLRWGDGPDSTEKILELPRCLPPDHNLSGNLVFVCESHGTNCAMVFVIDPLHGSTTVSTSLFHVLTRKFDEKNPFSGYNGYVVTGGRLYFVGGCYPEHDVMTCIGALYDQLRLKNEEVDSFDFEDAMDMVQNSVPKYLEVPTYNLTKREWELNPSNLNAPKPNPIVFVYEGKIYALTGRHRQTLRKDSTLFEVLDTRSGGRGSTIWKKLRPPTVKMEYYCNHFLDEENGIFYLFFEFPNYHWGPAPPCLEFPLKKIPGKKPMQWCGSSKVNTRSKKPASDIGLKMRNLSEFQAQGCIVDDILFCYESDHKSGKPVIVGYDMGHDDIRAEQWVIGGLDEVLKGKVRFLQVGFLNHLGNLRFCLVIHYGAGTGFTTSAVFTLTFELTKIHKEMKGPNSLKTQKAKKFDFSLKLIRQGAFHLPLGFVVKFCKNL